MTDKIDESIVRLLKGTDLSDKQKLAYAALLTKGEATITQIATAAKIKRPITYVVMDELVQKGYAQRKPDASKKLFTATDPSMLLSDMKSQIQNLEEMLPYLKAIQKRAGKPYIQYFEGEEGAVQAFSQIHKPQNARYALSIPSTKAAIPKELERWQKLYFFGKTKTGGKHFVRGNKSDDYITALNNGQQEVRFVPDRFPIEMDMALVDNSVYLAGFDETVHITVIHSKAIYELFCTVYDVMWSSSALVD